MQNAQQSSPTSISTVTQQNPNGDVIEKQISRQPNGVSTENIGVVNNQAGFMSKTRQTVVSPNTKAFESTVKYNGQTVQIAADIKNGHGNEMIQTTSQNGQKSITEKPIDEQRYNQLFNSVQDSTTAKSIFTGSTPTTYTNNDKGNIQATTSSTVSTVSTNSVHNQTPTTTATQTMQTQQAQVAQPAQQAQPANTTAIESKSNKLTNPQTNPQVTNIINNTTINQIKSQKQKPEKQVEPEKQINDKEPENKEEEPMPENPWGKT